MSFLIDFLQTLATWLQNALITIPLYLFNLLLTGLAALINDIPAPSFFTSAAGYISSVPSFPAYLLGSMEIGTGFTIIVTACCLRFLIRRIPFIG